MPILSSGNYQIAEFGVVRVNLKRNMRNITARWKGGSLNVWAPYGIEMEDLADTIRRMAPRLEARRPEAPYRLGQTIQAPEFSVSIQEQRYAPDKMLLNYHNGQALIQVGSSWDLSSPATIKQISKFLCRIAQSRAQHILIPRAIQIAQEVGKQPLMWTISNGHRALGHCSSKGVIALSYALVFYPPHLRDYVVKHELAHLSEMNHSERFHKICDEYCDGREAELRAELRAFNLPIIR